MGEFFGVLLIIGWLISIISFCAAAFWTLMCTIDKSMHKEDRLIIRRWLYAFGAGLFGPVTIPLAFVWLAVLTFKAAFPRETGVE